MAEGRDELGQFAPGNRGGPGRPRRATERAYLAALSDAITLDDWRAIVMRAVDDAKNGDAKAREWIASYVIGSNAGTLMDLAALEELEVNEAHTIRAEAQWHSKGQFVRNLNSTTPVERAIDVKRDDEKAAKAEQERAERERQKAERAARKITASTTE